MKQFSTKVKKKLFLGPFWLLFQKMRFFQKYWALSRTIPQGPLTLCILSQKNNESIPRKLNHKFKKPIFALFWTLFAHFLNK